MTRKSDSDEPTEYDTTEEGIIESILDRAMNGYTAPSRIQVTARIEWAGIEQRSNGGVRTTTLTNLDLTGVRDALNQARAAREQAEQATPYRSYDAKGWHAQIRALAESGHRGDDAVDRAGLNVSERTLLAWLSESRAPSKANQDRIAQAYDNLRNREVNAARDVHRGTQHEVAEKLNAAIQQRYGAEVRFRDIQRFTLE